MQRLTSELYSLNKADWFQGLKMAVGGAVVGPVLQTLNDWQTTGKLNFDPKQIAIGAVVAGGLYLGKKFFTPAQVIIPVSEAKPATDK